MKKAQDGAAQVPTWMCVRWISQLVSALNNPQLSKTVIHVIKQVCCQMITRVTPRSLLQLSIQFPQRLYYPLTLMQDDLTPEVCVCVCVSEFVHAFIW